MQLTSTKFRSEFLSEARSSLELAIPSIVSQLAGAGTSIVDSFLMGLLGTGSLAAGALAGTLLSFLQVTSIATLSATGSIAAEAFGKDNTDRISRSTYGGLWLAAALCFPAMVVLWYSDSILLLLGQEESTVLLANSYLRAIMWGFPAAIGFAVLTDIATAVNRPRTISFIMLAGLLFSLPAKYALTLGKFNLPPLGLAGIGWVSTLSFWLSFIAAACWLAFHPNFREYKLFSSWPVFDKTLFVEIFLVGWPVGIQMGADLGMYSVTALLMGYFGTDNLAAHRIAMQFALIAIVVSSGISYATTMRVGQRLGQKDPLGARRAVTFDLVLVIASIAVIIPIGWFFAEPIVAIFLDTNNPNNVEAVKAAVSFLHLALLYMIVFGLEFIAVGALLGLKDTRVPMLINISACWGIGLGGGYLMAFTLGWGGVGLWWGLILGIGTAAVLLNWRFYHTISGNSDLLQTDDKPLIDPVI